MAKSGEKRPGASVAPWNADVIKKQCGSVDSECFMGTLLNSGRYSARELLGYLDHEDVSKVYST
jgi:hypothetical protein